MDTSTTIVGTSELNDSAVTTAKINDSAVTTAKINDGAVTDAKITGPISRTKLTTNVTGSGSGSGSVTVNVGAGWTTVATYSGNSSWVTSRPLLIYLQCGWSGATCSTSVSGSPSAITGRLVFDGTVVAQITYPISSSRWNPFIQTIVSPGSSGAKTVTFQVEAVSGSGSVTIENVAISTIQW